MFIMGVKTLECHWSIPFQVSAIHFDIEQVSDFQPYNDRLNFYYSSFNGHSLLFPNSSLESDVSIMYHNLLCHNYSTWSQDTQYKMYMEKFSTLVWFIPF